MKDYTPVEREMLNRLQRGVEPVARPFADLPLPEGEVIALIRRAQTDGLIRRFGAIFDARRLGYKSILCALELPADAMEDKAAILAAHPGVTHCYERRPLQGTVRYPQLWFTLALLHDQFSSGFAILRRQLETPECRLFELPALRRFKIDVIFDVRTVDRDETFPGAVPPADVSEDEGFRTFTWLERAMVRLVEQQIPAVERPFDPIAEELGLDVNELLSMLRTWQREGVLRRIAAVLHHREAGFKANAMCVWPVTGDIIPAGRRVAARSEVTHCYQRPRCEGFPFDLYAMIHTASWPRTEALFEAISAQCGLQKGVMLASLREFKKSSMRYFE